MAKSKVKIKLDSAGIEELLNSAFVEEAVKDAAEDLKDKIKDFHDPEEEWQVERSDRKSRATYNITTNDPELKWKEFSDPQIAKTVKKESRSKRSKKVKGS